MATTAPTLPTPRTAPRPMPVPVDWSHLPTNDERFLLIPNDYLLIEAVRRDGPCQPRDLSKATKLIVAVVQLHLVELVSRGLLVQRVIHGSPPRNLFLVTDLGLEALRRRPPRRVTQPLATKVVPEVVHEVVPEVVAAAVAEVAPKAVPKVRVRVRIRSKVRAKAVAPTTVTGATVSA